MRQLSASNAICFLWPADRCCHLRNADQLLVVTRFH
uniref:Uncharacterized protein n=1 Tax=Rhizophora mucronata TaxID=61149 RepID=A0A2P2QGW8_RHIMU